MKITLFVLRTDNLSRDQLRTASSFGNLLDRWYYIDNFLFINGFDIPTEWFAVMLDYEAIDASLRDALNIFLEQPVDLLVAYKPRLSESVVDFRPLLFRRGVKLCGQFLPLREDVTHMKMLNGGIVDHGSEDASRVGQRGSETVQIQLGESEVYREETQVGVAGANGN